MVWLWSNGCWKARWTPWKPFQTQMPLALPTFTSNCRCSCHQRWTCRSAESLANTAWNIKWRIQYYFINGGDLARVKPFHTPRGKQRHLYPWNPSQKNNVWKQMQIQHDTTRFHTSWKGLEWLRQSKHGTCSPQSTGETISLVKERHKNPLNPVYLFQFKV